MTPSAACEECSCGDSEGTAASGAEDRRIWHVTANRLLEYCVLDQSELMTRKTKYMYIKRLQAQADPLASLLNYECSPAARYTRAYSLPGKPRRGLWSAAP
jgi:hypothetical protein